MHRFFVEGTAAPGEEIAFGPAAARQMARVLRLAPGDRVAAVDPEGWELVVELTRVDRHGARGRVLSRERRETEPPLDIVLAQGIPKGEKMDFVVQKGTEVGVSAFLPTVTRRTVVDLGDRWEGRRERWQRIAREAAEQCGRVRVPEVLPVMMLEQAVVELAAADLFLIPWEEERARGLRSVLREVSGAGAPRSVAVLIGPEGGFAADEVRLAVSRGARPVSLGPRLLRTETAGLVVVAALLYELGDLG